ncbi:hypothetical protein [Sphaerotilus sp.]|uniref:hypothetical protein n=1 Tax=Sphaerotilus sp. TaxID=2093942 RepID=UPI002ACD9F3D|nr:hypothetical protein [Sphaerotilus sp.]MDZ7856071.1 hypothetical protein [Sphaerotilus sp.]
MPDHIPARPPSPPGLLIAHASAASAAGLAALKALQLPHLDALLGRLTPASGASPRPDDDEYTLSAPHERVLAEAHGWQGSDGRWPWAAASAAEDGLRADSDTSGDPWGLITPVHWHVGSDQIALVDPAALALTEAESRTLFDLLKPSFDAEGWSLQWGAPLRWYVRHPALAELPTASLDRAIGRNLDLWLSDAPQTRKLRRLQVEAQMLWHEHDLNEAREAARQLTVNSFWLSGCGPAQPRRPLAASGMEVDMRLRAPLLANEWADWVAAWHALDAGPIAALLRRAEAGEPVTLTLCGERVAQTWAPRAQGWLGRLLRRSRPASAVAILQAL